MTDKPYKHKATGKVWIVLLVDRSVLGASAVGALYRDECNVTFRHDLARQFPSEKAAARYVAASKTIPPGYGAYPAEVVLRPRKRVKKLKVQTPFGVIKILPGETTFLDKVGSL